MRAYKKLACILGVIGLLVFSAYLYWKPIPIVADPRIGAIDIVKVRNTEDELVLLEEYDEDSILQYLATCKERRTLSDAEPYSMDDVDVMLLVFDGDSMKQVLLGDINNVIYGKTGTRKHEILDADSVRQNLFALLQAGNAS